MWGRVYKKDGDAKRRHHVLRAGQLRRANCQSRMITSTPFSTIVTKSISVSPPESCRLSSVDMSLESTVPELYSARELTGCDFESESDNLSLNENC